MKLVWKSGVRYVYNGVFYDGRRNTLAKCGVKTYELPKQPEKQRKGTRKSGSSKPKEVKLFKDKRRLQRIKWMSHNLRWRTETWFYQRIGFLICTLTLRTRKAGVGLKEKGMTVLSTWRKQWKEWPDSLSSQRMKIQRVCFCGVTHIWTTRARENMSKRCWENTVIARWLIWEMLLLCWSFFTLTGVLQ